MKKILMIIGGIVVFTVILFVAIFTFISANSKKLVCKSKEGNITIMYTDSAITGYTAKNMTYNLKQRQTYAKQIGIEAYLEEFSEWFKTNTTGNCKK